MRKIDYTVCLQRATQHLMDVTMRIEKPDASGQKLTLPNWIPGSYTVRDFAQHIVRIEAFQQIQNSREPLKIEKITHDTWQCAPCPGAITVQYLVYANDRSVRAAYLDDEHAFFNGCSVFLYAQGLLEQTHQVKISDLPPRLANKGNILTTLPQVEKGCYQAQNYQQLIDHPFEIAQFALVEFEAQNIAHTIAVLDLGDADLARMGEDVSKICQTHLQLFESPAPFARYVFFLRVFQKLYGGLEHSDCSVLNIARDSLPVKNDTQMSRGYISLLGLFSHEYFHAWNVKKIKPECFVSLELQSKQYTRQLWAFEGITSYYDDLALVRSKVIQVEQYCDILAQSITRLLRNPGRKWQTLSESSFDCWIKFYRPNENSANAQVSYYLKGALMAWLLDLLIRNEFANQRCLDDLMRTLWQEYGKTGKGLPEGKIEAILKSYESEKINNFLQQALYTTDDFAWETFLEPFGLELTLRVAESSEDLGGRLCKEVSQCEQPSFQKGSFDWLVKENVDRVIVAVVYEGGSAQLAGIMPEDEIVAINQIKVTYENFAITQKKLQAGQECEVCFFREGRLKKRVVTLHPQPLDTAEIMIKPNLTAQQKENLNRWLWQ